MSPAGPASAGAECEGALRLLGRLTGVVLGGFPCCRSPLCPICRSCAFQRDAPAALPALPGARGEETSPGRKLVLTTCSGRGELGEPLEEGARSRARLRLGQVCAGSSETQKHLAGIWILLLFFPFLSDIWLFSNHCQILVKCRGFSFFLFFLSPLAFPYLIDIKILFFLPSCPSALSHEHSSNSFLYSQGHCDIKGCPQLCFSTCTFCRTPSLSQLHHWKNALPVPWEMRGL